MSALPTLKDVSELFAMLFGDRTICQPFPSRLSSEQAAVIATYRDNRGSIRRVLACDLGFANSAGASLSMISPGAVNDAIKRNEVPDNILANLHEVLNIAVNLFTDSFDGRLELASVSRRNELNSEIKAALNSTPQATIEVAIPRYAAGRVAMIVL